MNKKIIIAFTILIAVFLIGNTLYTISTKKEENEDFTINEQFKKEYESLNNELSNGKRLLPLEISKNNPIVYKTEEEIIQAAKDKKSFVVLFGFSSCPWCRAAVPTLLEAAKNTGIAEIYYLNVQNIRDTKELNNNKIVTTKEGSKGYYELLKQFDNVLDPYQGLEDDSIKRILSPTVLFVHNGVADSVHVSTVESHKDPFVELNSKQKEELLEIYTKKIQDVLACPIEAC